MEIKILDMIQNLHTTVGDHFFIGITKLGDAGIIWIFLTILLLILPKMRKYGLAMLVGLCIDVIVCNGLLKNLVAPGIQQLLLLLWQRYIFQETKKFGRLR